jgi:hypothetical protein
MATATTFADQTKSAACSSGVGIILVIGGSSPLRLNEVKVLISNRLTPISHLVTYREDCRVRYKMTA